MILSIIWLVLTITLVAGFISVLKRNRQVYQKLVAIIANMDTGYSGDYGNYKLTRYEVEEMLEMLDGGSV